MTFDHNCKPVLVVAFAGIQVSMFATLQKEHVELYNIPIGSIDELPAFGSFFGGCR